MTKAATAPSIRANVLAGIVQELRHRGAAVDRLLRKHVGNTDLFADPYEQIPLAAFVGFLEDAAQSMGDPALGAKLGVRSQPEDFGPIGQMFLAAPNLRVALSHVRTFYPVWQGGTRVGLDTRCEQSFSIFDADSGQMEGSIPAGYVANLAIAPDDSQFLVSETYWTHGSRGKREDLLRFA